MTWRWTAHRWLISAYLLIHLSATFLWNLPACPIKLRTWGVAKYYMLPLGLWQFWGMFAPDPVRDSVTLEAEVIDSHGMRQVFSFTRLCDYSKLAGMLKVRHSKYAANMHGDALPMAREFAARHAVRTLGLPEHAFPVDVNMLYQVTPTPPPGTPLDPMTPTVPMVLGTYHFATLAEVRP